MDHVWFLVSFFSFICIVSAQLPHVKCRVKHKKIGCFHRPSSMKILFTDRLLSDKDNRGHEIDWYNWDKYLHSLACRCNEAALNDGHDYFILHYFGLCYGSKDFPIARRQSSAACVGYGYRQCTDSSHTECVGNDRSFYVYETGRDGGYGDWGSLSPCSTTCGAGIKTRTRNCTNPVPTGLGRSCSHIGPASESSACTQGPCIVDGGFSNWTAYSSCSKTCGGGFMRRERFCNNPAPANGGKNCTGPYTETKSCVNDLCTGSAGVSKAEKVVENFLVDFHKTVYPTETPSGKFHQAIFAIQQAVANEFAMKSPNKTLDRRLSDLRKFLKAATGGGSIDFARATLGKSLFVFMKKKIKEGLPIDDMDKASKGYLESIKKDIGSKKFGELMLEKGDATLMFVVDTTGSMSDEINAAKGIANYIINMPRQFPVDYILSPFNDPSHGPVTHKEPERRSEFVTAIQNLAVTGGGDCPELSFTGMNDALGAGPKLGSPMFVFTDASAKDDTAQMKQRLKDAASQYSTTITFFTNLNGCGYDGIKSYEEIAEFTSGQIFPLKSHSELLKFKDFVKNSLKSKSTIAQRSSSTSSATGKRSTQRRYPIQVDSDIQSLIVSLSAKPMNSGSGIQLADELGSTYTAQSSTPYTKVYSIENPVPGRWHLIVPASVAEVSFIAKAVCNNSIDFEHHFLHQETTDSSSPVLTVPDPLTGKPAELVLRVSNSGSLNRTSLRADIINEKGVVLLSNVMLADNGGSFQASINPPSGKFKVALKGMTKEGELFQRISHRLSEARTAFMMVTSAGDEFTASSASGACKIEAYIFNQGVTEIFSFRGAAKYGSVTADLASATIPSRSNTTISFTYTPSARSALFGKTDTITLTGNGNAATMMQILVNILLVP